MKSLMPKVNIKKDISQYVDFEKLRKSNDLVKKWLTRLKAKQNQFMVTVQDMRKNPKKYMDKLEQKYKSSFAKDQKTMYYAAEVENILLEQYYPMVISILKKLKISDYYFDDCLMHGLISVRNSVWQFKSHKFKASFFTFCYKGAYMRIFGRRCKLLKKYRAKKKSNLQIVCETDLCGINKDKNYIENTINKFSKAPEIVEVSVENDINLLLKECDLNEEELFIITKYINREPRKCGWNEEYRNKYPKADGSIMSKQGVHNKLMSIQKKIYKVYCNKIGNKPDHKKIKFGFLSR